MSSDGLQYRPGSSFFHRNLELGFQSLVFLAQAWSSAGVSRPLHIAVATMCSQRVVPTDLVQWPEQATVLGPARVIPREFGDVTVTAFDIDQNDIFRDSRVRKRLDALADTVSDVRAAGVTTALRQRGSRHGADGVANPQLGRRQALLDSIYHELVAPAAQRGRGPATRSPLRPRRQALRGARPTTVRTAPQAASCSSPAASAASA